MGGSLNNVRLLSEPSVARVAKEQVHAKDVVTGGMVRRTLGYLLPEPGTGDPLPLSAFGHPGMGGSIGFADPEHHLAVSYVMNKMVIGLDRRFTNLCRAVYQCIDQYQA